MRYFWASVIVQTTFFVLGGYLVVEEPQGRISALATPVLAACVGYVSQGVERISDIPPIALPAR